MRIKKVFVLSLFSALIAFQTEAQNYNVAIGLKGAFQGWGALNVKGFIGRNNALEGTIGGGRNFVWAEMLYEWQNTTGLIEGLDWYLGAGGVLGTWNDGYFNTGNNFKYNRGFHLGARGVIGLDYTFSDFPINLALDTGPYIGLINSYGFGWHGGLALRFTIK